MGKKHQGVMSRSIRRSPQRGKNQLGQEKKKRCTGGQVHLTERRLSHRGKKRLDRRRKDEE